MICLSCTHENRPNAKFCGGCGGPLRRACVKCGAELPPDIRFCDECGTRQPGPGPGPQAPGPTVVDAGGARKVVSILFADLAGSTALHERLDPESARRFMETFYALARAAVEGHGGTVAKLLGDGILAVFGIPRVAEDDAIRAVHAGVAMQEAFRALADQQRGAVGETGLRIAVNTGEVVVQGDEIIGDPVNVAARLQERAGNGDVVIGEATRRLVAADVSLEPLGSFDLKGRAEAVKAYRVVSLDAPGPAASTAFVGREDELARISAVYARAVETPAARLAVVLGSPGLGKSRLIDEFARRCDETATIVAAQCDAAGGATFAPIAEALRELLGREARTDPSDPSDPDDRARALRSTLEAALPASDPERDRIAAGITALLAGAPGTPEETFFVVRRFLAGLARTRPVILVIDDLQWAESLLLDLVEHLVQWGRDLPLLVLVGARPELREIRSSFVMPGGLVADVVALGALDAGVAMRLAAGVIGATDLPAAVAAKVLATSEGNPLFIGELVRMLVDEGALVRDGNRWTTGATLATVEMPPTIHALLAARIERLEPQQCAVLERAAVVGRQFSRSAVAALLPGDAGGLDAQLEALQRAQLIERDTGWLLGEPVLRFHHLLIRDAVYRRLLKGTRAELHERLANWIESRAGGAPEHDETIGRHLEEAHRLLRELGPVDGAGQHLGERAATRLAAAGRRALEGDDVQLAAGLLGRALQCLPPTAEARADLALDWCEALLSAGDVDPAAQAIAELGRCAGSASTDPQLCRLRAWHACFSAHLTVMTAPQELQAAVEAVAAAAAEFSRLGDGAGEAKAHFVHALALGRLGKVGACEAALDQALAAARRAGDRRRANTVLAIAPLAALWGPSPVTRASGRCLDVVRVLRITQGAPAVEAVALSCQGVLEALRGRTEAAYRMIASGREMVEELGIAQRLFETDVFAGFVAMLEGDGTAAERSLRAAYDGLRELGLGIDAARAAALLARALLAQGRSEEAEALSHESEALAGDDLKAAIAWRGVRAEALAKRGEHGGAIDLARAAVAIAATTDALLDHADARLALAVALRAAGRDAEADAEYRQAIDLWQAKGATLLVERAHRRVLPTAAPVAAPTPRVAQAPRRRPVRRNFAIEEARRAEAAVAARDLQALESLYRRDVEIVDHQFGIEYGRDAIFERVRLTIEESTDGAFLHENLATLGDFVALCRLHSTASGSVVYDVPFGATEATYLLVIEADDEGRARRIDIFGEDALRDAVVRLYERHAALLPEGAERTRAAATARSMAVLQSANADPERLSPVLAPDIEGIDHRHLSNWSLRGAPAYLEHLRALHQVADDVGFEWREILALAPDALLARTLHSGTERVGGGTYERWFLSLFVVGADGRFTRAEWFDDEREAEALARFDALVEGSPPSSPRRLVRPNAASANTSRFQAALAARDLVAVRALIPDGYHEIDHSTGTEWGREGGIASIERLLRSQDPLYELEPLATLGERLALNRRRTRASGDRRGRYDVGAYEHVAIQLAESDARGLVERQETFADGRLGDAIVRLYERHAELSPEGPARDQAAATARTIAVLLGPPDLDAWRDCVAAGVEFDDHRILGFGSLRGREAALPLLESIFETSESLSTRIDDVLALEPGAFLVHWTETGVAPGGGEFERVELTLWMLDGEGLVARVEYFDVGREADAIARFEALTGAPSPPARRRVRANAATRSFDRGREAITARNADALAELFDDSLTVVHHPTRATYGRRGMLATWRSTLRAERLEFRQEILASLGDRLALDRHVVTVEGLAEAHLAGFGASAFDQLWMLEVDEGGRWIRTEIFASDRVGDAMVRLYECYAEQQSEDAGRKRAAGIARALGAFNGPIDPDRVAPAYDPASRNLDHRVLGTWTTGSAAEILSHYRHQLELAPDFAARFDDVLAIEPDAMLASMSFFGTGRDSGGAFENRLLVLFTFGADGRIRETETFEAEQGNAALARFDEVTGQGEVEPFDNAASRADREFVRCFNTRGWAGIEQLAAPQLVFDERRRMLHNSCGREVWLEQLRVMFDVPASRFTTKLLATRGEGLALSLHEFTGEVAGGGGPLAMDDHFALHEVDGEGRIVAIVLFDFEAEDAAYAELDRRYDAGDGPRKGDARPSPADRGFSNAATRLNERFARAWAERDWDAVSGAYVAGHHVDDRRRLMQMRLPDGDARAALRFLFDVPGSRWVVTPLATRGEHLVLSRYLFEGAVGNDGGPLAIDYLAIDETNADGRFVETVLFDPDDFDAAYAELDRRYDAGEGRADANWQPALRLRDTLSRGDVDACRAILAPGFHVGDHRKLGWGDTLRDAETFLQAQLALSELSPDWRYRIDHHRARGLVSLGQQAQVGTREGGAFENPFVVVGVYDPQGLTLSFDIYDVDQLDEARARFEELAGADQLAGAKASSATVDPVACFFANSAVAAVKRGASALAARNWEEFRALFADDFRNFDRRALFRVESGRDEWLAAFRPIVEMTSGAPKLEVLATRGDRLALVRMLWRGAGGDVGPSEIDWLLLIELGIDGRHRAVVTFDAGDRDSAYAELDERFLGEGAADPLVVAWVRAFAAALEQRDWDALAARYAPDFVGHDHRLVSWDTLRGPIPFLEAFRAMVGLAADARIRNDHMRTSRRGFLADGVWMGTRDGGAFESQFVSVLELADDGRAQRLDFYDPHHIDQALARFREIADHESTDPGVAAVTTAAADLVVPDAGSSTPPLPIPPNAAMRAMSRWFDAYERAFETESWDWDELRRGCHPGYVFEDRRRMALLHGSIDLMVASARERAAMGARPEWQPVGLLGDRVLVQRVLWVGGPADGPFEIEYLGVVECDENGLLTAFVLFDLDDARAAQREAWARWAAIEPDVAAVLTPLGEALDAFNEKSAAKWRAAFADDLVVEDHRLAGMGRVEGADAYTESIVALWKLAPVTHANLGWRWPARDRHGAITVLRRRGTVPDGGGDFENEYLYLYVVARGRIARVEMFEMDALDKALARFEELRPPSPRLGRTGPAPLQIPPNEATRGIDRWMEAALAGDADAVVALLDPSYILEDRRPLFRTVSDRDTEIAVHLSLLQDGGWQPARTVLATVGDRLALQRWLWTKGEGDARSEIEFLEIDEVGDSGRFVRSILFDADDRAAASRELLERYIATDADGSPHGSFETMRGWNEHDLARVRGGLADDFVLDDHRLAGMGRIEGPDAYIESVIALFELIPDARTEFLYFVAIESHGRVSVNRTWGRNSEGGEVESVFVLLSRFRDGKVSYFEMFELEHLDVALARLADLRLERTNAATRARDRQVSAFVARDWDAVRRLATSDFVYEDRGKRALVTGDVEAWVASMQFTSQPGWRPWSTLLGTFGSRVALDRVVWSGEPGGDAFEFERIRVLEADADGHMRAVILFDREDHWSASYEAMTRFAATDGAECAGVWAGFSKALAGNHWDEARSLCAPDVVLVDHRPLISVGTLDGDQWIESLKAVGELSEGLTYDACEVLAWNERDLVVAVARRGTVPDGGGELQDGLLQVVRTAQGRLLRMDLFAEQDTAGALACFDASPGARG